MSSEIFQPNISFWSPGRVQILYNICAHFGAIHLIWRQNAILYYFMRNFHGFSECEKSSQKDKKTRTSNRIYVEAT